MSVAGSEVLGGRALGVLVTYVTAGGERAVADLADCWSAPFEVLSPVRTIVSYKGQRNFTGSWWCATTRDHVGYESWLERDHLVLLDFDPAVVGISSQPCALDLDVSSGRRRHTPDYFVRLNDGTGVVIDVRPDSLVAADAEVFEATAAMCELVGWRYRRLGGINSLLVANVRWLAGYRHPRCVDQDVREQLLRASAVGAWTVDSLAEAVGQRVLVLPTLFHLLWSGELTAELCRAPLRLSSAVWRAPQ